MPDDRGHMTPDEFRVLGKRMVDVVADYWERVEGLPVASRVKPGDVAAMLPEKPLAERGGTQEEEWEAIFADIERVVLPGLMNWQSPHFFGYFPSNISGPSVLGELLAAGLGVQGMLWSTSPACTEIEMRVLDWLGELIGLPEAFLFRGGGGGVIQGTASEAALAAMVAARRRVLGTPSLREGLVAYVSTQSHSSILKAAMIAGVATSADDRVHVRHIDVDESFAMRPEALAASMREDRAAGRVPFFVCATVGTTGTTAVDPVEAIVAVIGEFARPDGARRTTQELTRRPWLHVDAAHSGAALVCPEFRWMSRGLGHADSFCFNPHKWLLTNFDCDCFWTRSPRELTGAMSVTPEYLRNAASDSGAVVDYRDWHVPLGRRFRSLKLWFVLRHYGAEGLRAHIREHVRLAALFESLVREDARFEVVAPRTVNLVCFRLRALPGESPADTDARNKTLLDALNATGRLFLTHTVIPNPVRLVLRMAIGAVHTREEHVRAAWELIRTTPK